VLRPVTLRLATEEDFTNCFDFFNDYSDEGSSSLAVEKRYDQLGHITRLEIDGLPSAATGSALTQLARYSDTQPLTPEKAMPIVDTVVIGSGIPFGSTCEREVETINTALDLIMRLVSPVHLELDMSSVFSFYLDPTPSSLRLSPFARYVEMTRRWCHPFDQVQKWSQAWPRLESITWRHVPVKSCLCHSLPGISNRFIFAPSILAERNWGMSWGEAFAKLVSLNQFGSNTSWRLYGLETFDITLPPEEGGYAQGLTDAVAADHDVRMTNLEGYVLRCLRGKGWSEAKLDEFEVAARFRMFRKDDTRRE